MAEQSELARIRELIEILVAVALKEKGVPQAKISKLVHRHNNWTSSILRQSKKESGG
ncbi:MAG: hypothetical protein ACRD2L_04345 [Terriglobia bacterium]